MKIEFADYVHESMSDMKPFYIGKRTDCKRDCSWNYFGGFVIEEMDVL